MAAGSSAQAEALVTESLPMQPLNLSVRKPSAKGHGSATSALVQGRRTRSPAKTGQNATDDATGLRLLPYGTGFESRQQGAAASAGGGSGGGGSGNR